MNERIGYPEFILDAAQLDKKYDGVSTRIPAPRCEGTTQELGGVRTYTRSSLQRVRLLRALGYNEQFYFIYFIYFKRNKIKYHRPNQM